VRSGKWKRAAITGGALIALVLVSISAGCAGSSADQSVPTGVLPTEPGPVMYEFYTDS